MCYRVSRSAVVLRTQFIKCQFRMCRHVEQDSWSARLLPSFWIRLGTIARQEPRATAKLGRSLALHFEHYATWCNSKARQEPRTPLRALRDMVECEAPAEFLDSASSIT